MLSEKHIKNRSRLKTQFNFDALLYSNNYMYKIFGIYDYRTDTMSGIKLNLLFYQGQLGY